MSDIIRVALCDDHAVVRSGLRRLLADEVDLTVVGEAGTADEAVAIAASEHPDVFVMDLGLPGTSGIEATRRVNAVSPGTAVLVLTMHDDIGYLRKAFDAGAHGYLVKDAADVELVGQPVGAAQTDEVKIVAGGEFGEQRQVIGGGAVGRLEPVAVEGVALAL